MSSSSPPTRMDLAWTMPPRRGSRSRSCRRRCRRSCSPPGRPPGAADAGSRGRRVRKWSSPRPRPRGRRCRIHHGALPDGGDAVRHARMTTESFVKKFFFATLPDEVAQHVFADLEVGDHAVLFIGRNAVMSSGGRPSIISSPPRRRRSGLRFLSMATTLGSRSATPSSPSRRPGALAHAEREVDDADGVGKNRGRRRNMGEGELRV